MGDFVVECPAVDAFGFDVDVLRLEEDESVPSVHVVPVRVDSVSQMSVGAVVHLEHGAGVRVVIGLESLVPQLLPPRNGP